MKNIFLKKSKYGEELVPDPFLKSQNCAYLWIKSESLYSLILLYFQLEENQNIFKIQVVTTCIYLTQNFFKKERVLD